MEKGLSDGKAVEKLKLYGYNELIEVSRANWIKILWRQLKKNFIIYVLFVAVIFSFIVKEAITGYVILTVIFIIVGVGFIQEYRAERAIKALKKMIVQTSRVIRNGKEINILRREIVPGDLVVLRTGEKIPADSVILEEKELKVDESLLTGESGEITKKVGNLKNYKKENQVFMGTFVVNGRAIAQVIHTGMNTEFGKIAGMVAKTEKEMPLQNKINKITRFMAIIAIVAALLTGVLIYLFNPNVLAIEILIVSIAIAVSAFPEGFPVVLIATLAGGAFKMAKKNAIVNRMSIIETLGETTVICSDKTGTITEGEMTVKRVYSDGKLFSVTGGGYSGKGKILFDNKNINYKDYLPLNLMLEAGLYCNESIITRKGNDSDFNVIGNGTEAALLILAAKSGIYKDDLKLERLEEIPFSSERKLMSVYCGEKEGRVYVKGASEILIDKCTKMQVGNLEKKIDKEGILKINDEMTSHGLRTLILAYKKGKFEKDNFEEELVFLGLVGMEDPPRQEVKQAINLCKESGIKIKMITGDHKDTAISIAKQVGLSGKVMEGKQMEKYTDLELEKIVPKITIFARVRPEHKLRIVKALKKNGEIVTMTGDGVNDAPALKEAHIGVAMGIQGTDVSREVADLTLKDDNFSTIVTAIAEGRAIFNNIRKFVTYQLSCNYAEISVIIIGVLLTPFFGWKVPLLLALQILFMNLVTDDLPALTLGFNPGSHDIMKAKPRKKSNILNKKLFIILAVAGGIMAIGTLLAFYYSFNILGKSLEEARTIALLTLIFFEIANAFNFRSFRKPVLSRSPFVNKWLVWASIASIIATIMIIYIPFLNKIFETVPLNIYAWLGAFLISFSVIIVFDIWKWVANKK